MKRLIAIAVLLLASPACGGAKKPASEFPTTPLISVVSTSGNLHIDVFCQTQPAEPGVRVFQYTVKDSAGAPVTGLQFSVDAWMPQHNHSAPVDPVIVEMGDGVYQVQRVDLFAEGLWELATTITAPAMDTVNIDFQATWPS